ncbi:hypothetical protein GLOIN_2v1837855 [Rhizophagus irregularis DAOM 181602=DAOM 197198]|uniref:Uncharacterized protein n=1 Tax=Rhizophagus irregularis (strain DAOM 181602 / DAOM 197198 / MUCL 43194) TaxID=747089 RepID=A0A2P4QH62_RHIID|nr:hypothetical protein GLOIN_2v1837855 [Rhizophagus irregularis DAOM 181602=DAOM 197198]POG76981.1 hypothetical protein GLOIN_2v1837855 [Rhizophagus irregularis DAOM 181602=DAOM 197198]|eukprot:XP_025183847.1 hypothetical protein GLOIN_2v1837855 [Rhizophagus irregularis DAOM 181602=DAOM 197198]
MIISDLPKVLRRKSKYNTNRTYKAIIFSFLQETWEQIWERKLLPNLPSIINKIALEYSSMLNSFIPMKDIHDRWSNNFSKAVGLVSRNMEIFSQTQVIFQNFLFLCEKGIDTNNEDTFVHGMLHDLLNEIFRDPTFELIWANSERFVSKNCHTSTSVRLHLTPYDFKDHMSEVLEIFASDTLPSSPCSTYQNAYSATKISKDTNCSVILRHF